LFKDAIDGVNTVETQIADNDYAVGLLVEKVAHSKYANSTLIFVIEDDSQNGPDHVDAHRSIAFIAGPWVKQHALITKRFNTVTLLRTMEEVLGLKPLGLYDAVQPGMAEVFSTRPQAWSFSAGVPAVLRSSQLPLPALAPGAPAASPSPRHDATYWADHTRGFDFSAEDKLDSASFNLILWNGLKDEGQAYPEDRDGRDLRHNRRTLLQEFNRQSTR
ncbi:MAG TPA: hypothetical protein VFT65_14745, partial [Candidatus Angelobacter sp.]|nr:hypothetical protein [Candidatus Angelobacter sp.]